MRSSMFMRVGAALFVVCALLGTVTRVRAFSDALTYVNDASQGGGGGRWFTGSPAEGYGCSVCHTGAPGQAISPLHVEGLPSGGYAPGSVYSVRLSWPEFTALAEPLQQTAAQDPNAPMPAMSVVAELLAENGTASGQITLDPSNIEPEEYCELPAGRRAATVYQVKPAASLADSAQRSSPCDANDLGTRCLVTALSCGAKEVRFLWTAPPSWQGPIWFSAGLVTTLAASQDPTGDSVQEVSQPLMPATSGSQQYESVLSSGCSAARAGAGSNTFALVALLFSALLGLRARARSRRTASLARSRSHASAPGAGMP